MAVILGLVRSILDSYFTTRFVELPPPPAATWPATAKRVALVVLDGLRPMEAFNPDYMPALAARRSQAAWGVARSGEITMTVPGVRMLGAGVSSDFMEIFHNWNPRVSPVTSVLALAKQKGLRTFLYGDHVWKSIFTADFVRNVDVHLDAWTYYNDPVHAPDSVHLADLRKFCAAKEPFDLLVTHLVGPDHASHRYRVNSKKFQEYTQWLDPKLDELVSSLLAMGTTVLVTSDHGMSDLGQHGGDEPTARKTPYLLQGPGIKIGAGPFLSQADLPATLAALLGLPMPPYGEGRVAHEVLDAPPATILAMMRANVGQAQTYLRSYQAKYGSVPGPLLGGAPDLATIASQHGLADALSRADRYLEQYRNERRSVDKSVWRTWAWLLTIVIFVVLVLLPRAPSVLPRGTLVLAGLALLFSGASWVSTVALWPAVVSVLVASAWQGHGVAVKRRSSLGGYVAPAAGGLAIFGLLALAHLGFKRQFRSETIIHGVPDLYFRAAGYLFVVLIGTLFIRWRRSVASGRPRQWWLGLAIIFPFFLMLPSGKVLLLMSPGLGLGFLWIHRLARISETRPQWRLAELLESEWFLFVASLAWICVETWATRFAPSIDQERGVLGWTLNRVPWLLAPALVYQQLARGKEVREPLAKALSILSVSMALPPLLLAHHTASHFTLLVWFALLAMIFAGVNFRSPLAKYQLGAATFALASLFGSASYALTCFVVFGSYFLFVLAPTGPEPRVPGPPAGDDDSSIIPELAALGICFVWLAVQLLRDGSFSFSDYEVTVGFYGNPTHDIGRGALQVTARSILPMVLLLIPMQRLAAAPRVIVVLIALVLVHIGYLLVGFLATQSQFYTPYRLAGELAHFVALIPLIPLVYLLFSMRGNPRRADITYR